MCMYIQLIILRRVYLALKLSPFTIPETFPQGSNLLVLSTLTPGGKAPLRHHTTFRRLFANHLDRTEFVFQRTSRLVID